MKYSKKYLAILDRVNDSKEPFSVRLADIGEEEFSLYLELYESGYIECEPSRELNRVNRRLLQVRPSLPGRQFHEELKSKIFKNSWKGRSLTVLKFLGGFIVGILAMVVKDEIKDFRDANSISQQQNQNP